MNSKLSNKNILLGITGSIAAYKAIFLARLLVKLGANVRVVMTQSAAKFITELTMQAITGRAVRMDLFDPHAELGMGHIELAKWADSVIIAPTTANFFAKLANGMADDLLSTLCLAISPNKPIYLAAAMNKTMWQHEAVAGNIRRLQTMANYNIINPGYGEQACGDYGDGRMVEPEVIVDVILEVVGASENTAKHKKILITAGPTLEAIDPVRYISNHSSGKMGYSLANAAANSGYDVTLISGPVDSELIRHLNKNIKLINIKTADQMMDKVENYLFEQDIFIGVAAVADYKSNKTILHKIKKQDDYLHLTFEKNPDILQYVGEYKKLFKPSMTVVGFAAETENLLDNAKYKLHNKNLDLIILNDINNQEIGFNSDENEVTVIAKYGDIYEFNKQPKESLAHKLIELIEKSITADEIKSELVSEPDLVQ